MKILATIEGQDGRIEVVVDEPTARCDYASGLCSVIDTVVGRAKAAYKEMSKSDEN